MVVSFLKAPPYEQGGVQCAGAFFELSMGIRQKKKSLPSLVMSGLKQYGNEASVFYQKTWLRAFWKYRHKRRAVVSVLVCFLKCRWGFVKKKSLPSLVMAGLRQHDWSGIKIGNLPEKTRLSWYQSIAKKTPLDLCYI
jgi:hypothetical protein